MRTLCLNYIRNTRSCQYNLEKILYKTHILFLCRYTKSEFILQTYCKKYANSV
nr:MAG TPA: hypothetical protein [Caudoviricetes sp.]